MWVQPGEFTQTLHVQYVKAAGAVYSTNSASASVNNRGSLLDEEIKALIAVWGEIVIQEEQGFEFLRVESANPNSNLVQCNPNSYV